MLAGGYFNSPDDNNFCGRLAYIDFEGEEVLNYLKQNPNVPLDDKFLANKTPQCVEGIDKLCAWLDNLKS